MKKRSLNLLGRKSESLFGPSVEVADRDNVEFRVVPSAIPESGMASVRSRPTVKHVPFSLESFHGHAVPTPTVPVLPPASGPKVNGSVVKDPLPNGSVLSGPKVSNSGAFVPPPPSTAPPPPPPSVPPPAPPDIFIPPPPDFLGDLSTLNMSALQPPSMPAPNPPFTPPPTKQEDLSLLKPPPMAPPKPPSTSSTGSSSSAAVSGPPLAPVSKAAPPVSAQPPAERQHKTFKAPPPKPVRTSSAFIIDSPPHTPASTPPQSSVTASTFNPQITAKVYDVPKTTFLKESEDHSTKPKQMLILEDPQSGAPVTVLVSGDTKKPTLVTPPTKPVPKDVEKNLEILQPPLPETNKEPKTDTVSSQSETPKPPESPKLQPVTNVHLQSGPTYSRHASPILDRKLRNLRANEISGVREGSSSSSLSPLALLQAAKEREKLRTSQPLSREGSNTSEASSSHRSSSPSESFAGTSIADPPAPVRVLDGTKAAVSAEHAQVQTPQKQSGPLPTREHRPSSDPAPSKPTASSIGSNLTEQTFSPSYPQTEELDVPLLPPPPEFDDFSEITEPPPTVCSPVPPMKNSTSTEAPPSQVPAPPPNTATPGKTAPPPNTATPGKTAPPPNTAPPGKTAPPPNTAPPANKAPPPNTAPPANKAPPPNTAPPGKTAPPPPPTLPRPDKHVKPKPQVQTKLKLEHSQLPTAQSPSQATLVSILQRKMLEMDQKMTPMKEAESTDDWVTSPSDEDKKVPVVPRAEPQSQSTAVPSKAATLNMKELESKVVKKYQSSKAPTSSEPKFKQQYGKTFNIRPGSKQPITLVTNGDA
ncbi:proline-rich extensin-like protein EPR1 [Oryzias latipes]|uniref:proline-rich extensin-like protein EPR1 n=1 Tax=Oryzias latipes TaxID=8090 RepID=UPI0002A4B2EB|nr:proline-rich extensin-like protein EPR1 [Oryzias latipes]